MGGIDTKGRFHVHWGPPEQYGERREESALRRSGRPVPDPAYTHFEGLDVTALDEILARYDHDPKQLLPILEATQEAYGYLPVAALKHISGTTGAWYAMLYGTATYYRHLRLEPPAPAAGTAPAPTGSTDGGADVAYRDAMARRSATRRAGPRASPPDADVPQDAPALAAGRPRAGRRDDGVPVGHGLGRRRRAGRCAGQGRVRRPPPSHPRSGRGGDHRGGRGVRPAWSGRRRVPHRREVARRGDPARAARRHRQRLRRRSGLRHRPRAPR